MDILPPVDYKSFFQAYFNHSGLAMVLLTPDCNFHLLNHEAEHMFGWRTNEVIGKSFLTLCRNKKIDLPSIDMAALSKGVPIKHQRLKLQKKQEVIYSLMPITDNEGVLQQIIFFGEVAAPGLATEASVGFDKILNALPYFIFWKDKQLRFAGCNRKFMASASLNDNDDILGKTDFDMPWSDQANLYRQDDQAILSSGMPKLDYEEMQPQLDGSLKTMLVSKVPLFDEQHNVKGILGIYNDITMRKRSEKELEFAKKEAETANELKGDFIRNMQHDIRTPFNGIYGMATLLADQEDDLEKKSMLEDIAVSADQLLDYCNTIMRFSKIEADQTPVVEKNLNLKELLEKIIAIEKPAAQAKSLGLHLTLDPKLPKTVLSDSYRLRSLFINLLSNAIKFTEQGHVGLLVSVAKIESSQRQVVLKFVVEDTGVGIPHEKQDLIYEKFTRINPSFQGKHRGQGLGLHIVRQFITELDGDIDLESKVGEGSTFTIYLSFKLPLFAS